MEVVRPRLWTDDPDLHPPTPSPRPVPASRWRYRWIGKPPELFWMRWSRRS